MGQYGSSTGKSKFACREIDDVHLVGQQMIDFLRLHVLALGFTLFHEVDVILQERSVQHAWYLVSVTDVGYGTHVFQRYRLTSNEVGSGFDAHKAYVLWPHLFNGVLQ